MRIPEKFVCWDARIILMSSSLLVKESFEQQLCSCQHRQGKSVWHQYRGGYRGIQWPGFSCKVCCGKVQALDEVHFPTVGPGQEWTGGLPGKLLQLLDYPLNTVSKNDEGRGRNGQAGRHWVHKGLQSQSQGSQRKKINKNTYFCL